MEQIHGGTIKTAKEVKDQLLLGCDGVVTKKLDVALIVRTADCLPVVVYAPSHEALGVAHAGWRGLREELPVRLIKRLFSLSGATPLTREVVGQVEVSVGPGIGPCCYAVGPEFEAWFPGYLEERKGKRFLDLQQVAIDQLVGAGIPKDRIVAAPWCTACSPDLFFSYRREGKSAGRMLTCAMLTRG